MSDSSFHVVITVAGVKFTSTECDDEKHAKVLKAGVSQQENIQNAEVVKR